MQKLDSIIIHSCKAHHNPLPSTTHSNQVEQITGLSTVVISVPMQRIASIAMLLNSLSAICSRLKGINSTKAVRFRTVIAQLAIIQLAKKSASVLKFPPTP